MEAPKSLVDHFKKLTTDAAWLAKHKGQFVAIIEGNHVLANHDRHVLKTRVMYNYPGKKYLIQKI